MEQYFYCKYGGIGPICSDCKRNPINSLYKPSTIGTWLLPNHIKTNGTGCTDYIPIKEPIMVNKQEFIKKACEWLNINFPTIDSTSSWYKENFIKQFKKTMKEQL